jgi:hypothetical protein
VEENDKFDTGIIHQKANGKLINKNSSDAFYLGGTE